jgi:hypothetical protein
MLIEDNNLVILRLFMKKKQSHLEKISSNFKNLIPYIGALFVVAGIIGLLFIQKPLQTSQDNRSEAFEYVLKSCGETCATNKDCMINFRCYQSECRLAANPTNPICDAVTKKEAVVVEEEVVEEVSQEEDTSTSSAITNTQETPTTKGDDVLSDPDLEFKKQQNALAEKKTYDESFNADETLLDLFKDLVVNSKSKLPFFIILFGVMLLLLSIFATLLTRLKNSKHIAQNNSTDTHRKINVKSYAVNPSEASRNSAAKDLLKTLENQPKA